MTIDPGKEELPPEFSNILSLGQTLQRSKFGVTHHPQHHPHHIPQHGQYSEYEFGMVAYNYNTAVITDWPLPPYGIGLIAAIREYDQHHSRDKQ
ncbi:hypothetical protein A2U01_0070167, partial [Trifolium medium]|nr:hypothetical protein [Trifolium medium]